MTKQEYKELLIKTSLEGGFPSCETYGFCRYKDDKGKKCAVGLLIPDDRYHTDMDFGNFNLARLIDHYNLMDVIPEGLDVNFLRYMQRCHDIQVNDITHGKQTGWDHERFVSDINKLFGE